MTCYAIRGAITVDENTKDAVDCAVRELMSALYEANGITDDDIVSVIFSQTKDITSRNDFNFEKVQNSLSSYKINLNDFRVQSPNMTVALCHNDLSGSNILLNPENDDVLSGIIDFGNTVVMPKYQDFFPLYKINRKLVFDTLAEYNKITTSPIEQRQIDFMVLSYIGFGLAQNKNEASPYFMKLLKPFLEE